MRKKNHSNLRYSVIAVSIALLFNLSSIVFITSNSLAAETNQMILSITDESQYQISEITEEEHFTVSVYVRDEFGGASWLTEVEIQFNGKSYLIGEGVTDKIIEAPPVDRDTTFDIIASKEGYISAESTFSVLDSDSSLPKLIVTPEKFTVDVGEDFSVVVTVVDENQIEKPVEGIAVSILDTLELQYTDSNGRVWLTAPDDPGSITIQAQKKDVYELGQISIKVNDVNHWWEIIYEPYFMIVVAIVCLAFAIIFVNIRSKKDIYNRTKEITDEKMIDKYVGDKESAGNSNKKEEEINLEGFSGAPIRERQQSDPKIEEIRISRPKKEKEIVKVDTQEDKADKVVEEKRIKKKDYDWFEGKDEMRYEINKLTGDVDEEGLDKWFEGVGDLKIKIDEKVKKKDKKKKEEEES